MSQRKQPIIARAPKQDAAGTTRRNQECWSLLLAILGILALPLTLAAQTSPNSDVANPVLTDWSHHHLIFSKPATREQTTRVQQDPRYRQQQNRQSPGSLSAAKIGLVGSVSRSGSGPSFVAK